MFNICYSGKFQLDKADQFRERYWTENHLYKKNPLATSGDLSVELLTSAQLHWHTDYVWQKSPWLYPIIHLVKWQKQIFSAQSLPQKSSRAHLFCHHLSIPSFDFLCRLFVLQISIPPFKTVPISQTPCACNWKKSGLKCPVWPLTPEVKDLPQNTTIPMCTLWHHHMGVSKNRGTPKWTIYNGNPY